MEISSLYEVCMHGMHAQPAVHSMHVTCCSCVEQTDRTTHEREHKGGRRFIKFISRGALVK
jgi:hypothetical protein